MQTCFGFRRFTTTYQYITSTCTYQDILYKLYYTATSVFCFSMTSEWALPITADTAGHLSFEAGTFLATSLPDASWSQMAVTHRFVHVEARWIWDDMGFFVGFKHRYLTHVAAIVWLDQTLMKHNKDCRIIIAVLLYSFWQFWSWLSFTFTDLGCL